MWTGYGFGGPRNTISLFSVLNRVFSQTRRLEHDVNLGSAQFSCVLFTIFVIKILFIEVTWKILLYVKQIKSKSWKQNVSS